MQAKYHIVSQYMHITHPLKCSRIMFAFQITDIYIYIYMRMLLAYMHLVVYYVSQIFKT